MTHMEFKADRSRASSIAIAIIFSGVMFPRPAAPLSLEKNTVEIDIPFSPGSSVLSESSIRKLSNQSLCINAISVEVVLIVTTGDSAPSSLDGSAQMNLAAQRANVLRQSFRDLGVPDSKIFGQAEARAAERTPTNPLTLLGGIAKIEYIGTCKAGFSGKAECDALCKQNQ